MKKRLMLTALLVLFLFAGCGGSNSPSDTPQPQTPSGGGGSNPSYLNDNQEQDTEVLYIQWTKSNGQLTGSWNDAILQTNTIGYTNLPITGTYDSGTGAINFIRRNTDGSETPISGTIQNNKLVLQTQQNGQPINRTLHVAVYLDYQQALSAFRAKHPGS